MMKWRFRRHFIIKIGKKSFTARMIFTVYGPVPCKSPRIGGISLTITIRQEREKAPTLLLRQSRRHPT